MLEVKMEEEVVSYEKARLSFSSFIIYMAIAGFCIALVGTIFRTLFSLWQLIAGDPSISIGTLVKPFLSLLIDPLDALISGIVIYPIYKIVLRRYANLGMKLFKIS